MRRSSLLFALALLPLSHGALAQDGDAATGKVLYDVGCARCHGSDASGGRGGDLRALGFDALMAGHDYSRFVTIVNPQKDITQIAAYLGSL